MRTLPTTLLLAALVPFFAGCRGQTSDKPPVHLVLDMDFQAKIKAQSESKFAYWADARGSRLPVAGTVPHTGVPKAERDRLAQLAVFKDADGKYLAANPLPPSMEVLQRGRLKFDIHCAACHDRTGSGKSPVAARWPLKTGLPSFYEDRFAPAVMPDAQIFETITNGKNTMPAYGYKLGVEDRWAIVHYLRALQLRMKVSNSELQQLR